MAPPAGNQFWKLRSKHGRNKLFASPEMLWDAACEYFSWCDKHPWNKVDFKGAMVEKVKIPTERPYTISGLCLYLDCDRSYFAKFKSNLKADDDFFTVITRIEDVIYTQQFEGATVGAYNGNIIARALGLAEKKEVDLSGSINDKPDLTKLSVEELKTWKSLIQKSSKI